MAKDQSLSLNPTKISGICGRLMCCLKYENHMYCKHGCNGCGRSERIEIPKMGSKVVTTMGEGKVVASIARSVPLPYSFLRIILFRWSGKSL